VYATPSYVFFSGGGLTTTTVVGATVTTSTTKPKSGLFRTAIGADIGLTRSLGVTLGTEFGATRGKGVGGPSGSLFGLGLSYAFGRR